MGQTALLPFRRKACWGFFRPENPTASAVFEPANLGTKGQHATSRPPKMLNERILGIERGHTRAHFVQNSLWKRLYRPVVKQTSWWWWWWWWWWWCTGTDWCIPARFSFIVYDEQFSWDKPRFFDTSQHCLIFCCPWQWHTQDIALARCHHSHTVTP